MARPGWADPGGVPAVRLGSLARGVRSLRSAARGSAGQRGRARLPPARPVRRSWDQRLDATGRQARTAWPPRCATASTWCCLPGPEPPAAVRPPRLQPAPVGRVGSARGRALGRVGGAQCGLWGRGTRGRRLDSRAVLGLPGRWGLFSRASRSTCPRLSVPAPLPASGAVSAIHFVSRWLTRLCRALPLSLAVPVYLSFSLLPRCWDAVWSRGGLLGGATALWSRAGVCMGHESRGRRDPGHLHQACPLTCFGGEQPGWSRSLGSPLWSGASRQG